MKAPSFKGILTSQPCKFVVGEAGTEFFLHSDLVKRESGALGKIIDTSFAEGQKGLVVLRHDDAETISAFAQFIYTGNYSISFDMSAPDTRNEPHDKGRHEDNKKRQWKQPRNGLWCKFNESRIRYNTRSSDSYMIPRTAYCSESETDDTDYSDDSLFTTQNMDKDYSELFISQAKVFAFAHYYGVEILMDLSMGRLHEALCGFRLSRERIGDILALVRYCYERPGPEKLKQLVAAYSAAIVNSQGSDVVAEYFRDLLRERGDFAADMAWFLACRVMGSERC
ncbi:hypothetical protein E4U34_004233 [Claviceps purpurea]|nr:hypothetical protein E4U34_004233 [Claviceps purpurea]